MHCATADSRVSNRHGDEDVRHRRVIELNATSKYRAFVRQTKPRIHKDAEIGVHLHCILGNVTTEDKDVCTATSGKSGTHYEVVRTGTKNSS
jgi:hypothetical protein